MTETELRRLSELRSLLEGFAARQTAAHADPRARQPVQLRAILRRLNAAIRRRDYAAFRAADEELHTAVVAAAEVPRLLDVWRLVWNGLQGFHRKGFDECFPDTRILIEEHEHLVETIILGDPVAAEDAARSHVEAVWFRLAEQQHQPGAAAADPLQRATSHLAFRLHCRLRLTDVAAKVAFTSQGNLSRLFRLRYGMSFRSYLQNLRLEKAAELLESTRLPIGAIARRVGYRDFPRFSQHFKRRHGVEPRRWRRAKQTKAAALDARADRPRAAKRLVAHQKIR
ncbi:MAG: helix-turn-helix domain-containing protein [Verrucomicrobia bacterium]|nr:helix-turn-helix domain-containing protein [Verrucomicrobiota bacterium]